MPLLAIAALGQFTVQGTITDSSGAMPPGAPIHNIRVQVWDEDPGFDDLLGTVYTSAAGAYSLVVTGGYGLEDPDVYIQVDWAFPLTSGFHVNLMGTTAVDHCGADPGAISFASRTSAVVPDYTGPGPLVIDQRMGHALATATPEALRLRVDQALQYYSSSLGGVSWAESADINVWVRTSGTVSFFCQNTGNIYICDVDITGTGGGFVSDIYHEMGHLVHYRFGGALPSGASPPCLGGNGSHNVGSESSVGFALTEAWPSYVADVTSTANSSPDTKYSVYRDLAGILWRGDEGASCGSAPTGYDGSRYESGEIVEGALGGVWYAIHSDPVFSAFATNFEVMVEDDPGSIFEFADGILDRSGGVGSVQAQHMFAILQLHGIVYSRARFDRTEPITADAPPDVEESDAGNKVVIDDILFLRGEIRVNFEEVPVADLGVASGVDGRRVRLNYKPASNGLDDQPASFVTSSGWFNYGFFSDYFDFDTKTLGSAGSAGDGDWDFLICGENEYAFTDTFSPSWHNDPTTIVSRNERYLKRLGAWFDQDWDPDTHQDEEGKVIVDNTPPKVENFKPSPNP